MKTGDYMIHVSCFDTSKREHTVLISSKIKLDDGMSCLQSTIFDSILSQSTLYSTGLRHEWQKLQI